ncbi:MAG: RNA polymerase sigma factor [Thermodesulfobacteriota bacterium]
MLLNTETLPSDRPVTSLNMEVADLVVRCNQGDRAAWDDFYARYYPMISRAVRRYGQRASEDFEDLAQEVFVQLFHALKAYDPSRPLEAYILEIVRRVRISAFRRSGAQKRGGSNPGTATPFTDAIGPSTETVGMLFSSSEEDQETLIIKAQEISRLRSALNRLEQACRSLLELRYDRGLSYKEIAETLRVREGTLRVRVQRCLASLGRQYLSVETGGAE